MADLVSMASNNFRKLFHLANCVPVRGPALKGTNAGKAVSSARRHADKPRTLASAAQEMTPEYSGNEFDKRRGEDYMQRGGKYSPFAVFGAFDSFFPNRSLLSMIDTMDRMFDDPFFSRPGRTGLASPFLSTSRPPWDFKETEDSYHMRMDLPGLNKEEVKVSVEEGHLVIKGEHKEEDRKKNNEDQWSRYSTRILLPNNANTEQIKAELKTGVLVVSVPKVAELQKSVIDVPIH